MDRVPKTGGAAMAFTPPRVSGAWHPPSAIAGTSPILEIGPGTVHVWRLESGRPGVDAGVLSADERERAARFHFERDRVRFVAAHHGLRTVLARYAGAGPAELRFMTEKNGKPFLDGGGDLMFNLSHSEDVAYIAIRVGAPVGIDVERPRAVRDIDDLAAMVFSVQERAELAGTHEASRNAAFLCAWTRKEAFVKALGLGITVDLPAITVGVTTDERVVAPVTGLSSEAVHVSTLACGPEEHVALACVGLGGRVECFDA